MNQIGATAGIIRIQVINPRFEVTGVSVSEMITPTQNEEFGHSSRMSDRSECLVDADTRALKRELIEEYRLLVAQLPA